MSIMPWRLTIRKMHSNNPGKIGLKLRESINSSSSWLLKPRLTQAAINEPLEEPANLW